MAIKATSSNTGQQKIMKITPDKPGQKEFEYLSL